VLKYSRFLLGKSENNEVPKESGNLKSIVSEGLTGKEVDNDTQQQQTISIYWTLTGAQGHVDKAKSLVKRPRYRMANLLRIASEHH
jgi:hypothetical protein